MLPAPLVLGVSLAYLLLLFAIASFGDRRARQGRSIIGNAWVYALSLAVYCTAWTYFGSVGRAASTGVWFLPIYLGPMLAMILAWLVVRKMIRIAKAYRITSIADFIASRYGKSRLLAGAVTLITVVGIVPYIALQLKAMSAGFALLTAAPEDPSVQSATALWDDGSLLFAVGLAGFAIVFGTRHLDNTERHEGVVAAVAFESVVKLGAFLAVGVFVSYRLFDGPVDIFSRAAEVVQLRELLSLGQGGSFAYAQWFSLTLLSLLSVVLLPRQFQVMVIENVDERHLRRAAWAFPLYLLLINLFVLPIALGGLLHFGPGGPNPETFVLSLPLAAGAHGLALLAFIGGLSAATGMVIVETIAVSTMVCNDLVMPLLLRLEAFGARAGGDVSRLLLSIRRVAIVLVLLLGYLYFRIAGEAYALVSIGLISFAAVAQFAPAMLGGLYWRGGTRAGALAGLALGFALWVYTLMLPSIVKSGWMAADFLHQGPFGIAWLKPEQLLGLAGLDGLTHSLFWSLLANAGAYVAVSLWRRPSASEASQAVLFVDVFDRTRAAAVDGPLFWRGQARLADLRALADRFLGTGRADRLFRQYARSLGVQQGDSLAADARLVQFVEMELAAAVGAASARLLVASVAQEQALAVDDVLSIVAEASQLRAHSQELEETSASLRRTSEELRQVNEPLKSLDRLKDEFMSSVTHELRTPLTSIRALSEMMVDDPDMDRAQRQQFLGIIVAETERLSRLVNQVLDLARIEAGAAEWHYAEVDLKEIGGQAVKTTSAMFQERNASIELVAPAELPRVRTDPDRVMQVLLNLLSNAAKFLPANGGRVQVRLHASRQELLVEVQDNGSGVPAGQEALIFERFRQGGDGEAKPSGTGLGLPICRQIVAHLGGRMWLEPAPGGGACFGFSLPLDASPPAGRSHGPHPSAGSVPATTGAST